MSAIFVVFEAASDENISLTKIAGYGGRDVLILVKYNVFNCWGGYVLTGGFLKHKIKFVQPYGV